MPPAHRGVESHTQIPTEVIDLIGGGGWTRTNDLRIMSPPSRADAKHLQQDSSAERGKVMQNPQLPRHRKGGADVEKQQP